jgi:hypothetical protein
MGDFSQRARRVGWERKREGKDVERRPKSVKNKK